MFATCLAAAQPPTSLWTMRLAAATRSFTLVLLGGVAVLLVVQFVYFGISSSRAQKRASMKLAILNAITRANSAKTQEERERVRIPGGKALFDRRGLAVLAQVFDTLSEANKGTLRQLITAMGGAKFIGSQLSTQNEDYLIEVVRMVGALDLVGLDARIVSLMYTHKHNVDLQYQAFMTLSQLGSGEHIVKVCMDESFVQTLSFRSLQQVLKSYSGDKAALYARLLSSPDAYVVRICIRRAGIEGFTALAGQIAPWLESDNYNIVIDAARALGLLHYAPAAQPLAALLKHERWEVRAVATTALAAIDLAGYEDALVVALQDREWQVRYNAAAALRNAADIDAVRQKVVNCRDRYAIEMLEFMAQTAQIWRQAQ